MAAVHAAQQAKEDEEKKDGVYIPGRRRERDTVE